MGERRKDKLKEIGFYTLEDYRVRHVNESSPMWRCEIILTEFCNFNCPYCRGLDDKIYGTRNIKQLTLIEVKKIIDIWCKDKPLKNIRFSGGEPMFYPYIMEVVKYAKEKGIKKIAISTNGSSIPKKYKEAVKAGCNDFSVSLDGCCSKDIREMSGGNGVFKTIRKNIRLLSKLTYVTVGIVLNENNVSKCVETIEFAYELGVSDIRIISSAQYNKPLPELDKIPKIILDKYPILKYRVNHFKNGINVRGIKKTDSHKCALLMDDSVVAGEYHFPCVIYMREKGKPIGKVKPSMREQRIKFMNKHDSYEDPICRKNCLDVCIDYNNRYRELKND